MVLAGCGSAGAFSSITPSLKSLLAGAFTGYLTTHLHKRKGNDYSVTAGAMGATFSAGAIIGASVGNNDIAGCLFGVAGGVSSSYLSMVAPLVSHLIGVVVLGTEVTRGSGEVSWNCWKPVLLDKSTEPSSGKLLRDVLTDSVIKRFTVRPSEGDNSQPQIIVENVEGESFEIDFVLMNEKTIGAHATKLLKSPRGVEY